MAFILKVMRDDDVSPVPSDNEYSLYSDIVSVSFKRGAPSDPEGYAFAHCYVREPVKTADVPGFVEVEKNIGIPATAYVMNENGKTVSSFTAIPSVDPRDGHKNGGARG